MDKFAQKRSLRSKVWESSNLTGKALEAIHSELAEVMDEMRAVDASIREAAGDVKTTIRQAKSGIRTRDYLSAAVAVSTFHERVRFVDHTLKKFVSNFDVKHYKYLLDNLDSSQKEMLFGYDPSAEIKEACEQFDLMTKEAGVLDWVNNVYDVVKDTGSNIVSDKNRARRLMEKRFNVSFLKELKDQTINIVSKSEKMLNVLLSIFSDLESGISRRNPRLYVLKAKEFNKKFSDYHKSYQEYHKKVIVPLKEQQDLINKEQQAQALRDQEEKSRKEHEAYEQSVLQDTERLKKQVQENPYNSTYVELVRDKENKPSVKDNSAEEALNKLEKERGPHNLQLIDNVLEPDETLFKNKKDIAVNPKAPSPLKVKNEKDFDLKEVSPNHDDDDEDEDDEEAIESAPQSKAAHTDFINKLTSFANDQETLSFIRELVNYSEKLENSNVELSSDLLRMASELNTEYKKAGIFDFLKKKDEPTEKEPSKQPELQREVPVKKQKPQDLKEQEENLFKPKYIEIPEGRIDEALTDVEALSRITPDNIRVTFDTAQLLMATFVERLSALKKSDISQFKNSLEKNLVKVLKKATHDGWVVHSSAVPDDFNPYDRYLSVYTRLNLSDIDPEFSGVAKITVNCRFSAKNGSLTIRGVKKYFTIENVKVESDNQDEEEQTTDLFDQFDQFDQDQFDYPDEP